jgi:hypothetical protein
MEIRVLYWNMLSHAWYIQNQTKYHTGFTETLSLYLLLYPQYLQRSETNFTTTSSIVNASFGKKALWKVCKIPGPLVYNCAVIFQICCPSLELLSSERSDLLYHWLRLTCCGCETLQSVWFEMCDPKIVLLTWQWCMYFNLDMSCGSNFCSDVWLRSWRWGRCWRLTSCRTIATSTSSLTCVLETTQ